MEYEAKIVVVGDSKVGKSTWVEGHQDYQPYAITTGVDFRVRVGRGDRFYRLK